MLNTEAKAVLATADLATATRRGVMAGSAAGLTLAAAAPAQAFGWGRRTTPARTGPDWADLARRLSGPLLLPTDPDFLLIAYPNNMRYVAHLPDAIARCRSARDVQVALLWAERAGVKFRTRSGGHSYAGYSAPEGGLMIETTLMNQAHYEASTGVAWIGGGLRNADVYRLLQENERAITHGRCPSVGAAGFLLGGGIGFNMRQSGLACDQLVASQMVLASGEIMNLHRDAPEKRRQDLFWAARGVGGGNLGISTGFALETFSTKGLKVTVFQLEWSQQPEAVAAALMAALDKAPDTLGSRISLAAVTPAQQQAGQDVTVNLLGQIKDTPEALERILAPVYAIARPVSPVIKVLDYWEAQKFLHEDGWPTWYQERSAFVNRPFGADALAEGFAHLRQWPGTCGYCDLRFFQTGGAVNRVSADATAFVHRDSRWLIVVGLYWSQTDNENRPLLTANHRWQDDFYAAMRPLAGGGAYQNFADPSLSDYRRAYYGQNLDALQAVRQQVDPAGVFAFEQSV